MKRVLLLSLAAASVVLGQSRPSGIFVSTETQAFTRAAPTLSTEGMSLRGVTSVHSVVRCSSGTLTGAGNMVCYFLPQTGVWGPCPTSSNFAANVVGAELIGPEFPVSSPFGRILWATSGLGCTAGSTAIVSIEAAQL